MRELIIVNKQFSYMLNQKLNLQLMIDSSN